MMFAACEQLLLMYICLAMVKYASIYYWRTAANTCAVIHQHEQYVALGFWMLVQVSQPA